MVTPFTRIITDALSADDRLVVRIAQLMGQGLSTAAAYTRAGLANPWSDTAFRANLGRVMNNPAATAAVRGVVEQALTKGPSYAGSALLRAATAIGSLFTPAVIIAVAVGGAVIVAGGTIYVAMSDKPILPGPRVSQPGQPPPVRGRDEVTYNQDLYYIFVLPDVSGGSIVISQESALKDAPTCSFSGGGLCQGNDPPVTYRIVSEGFTTFEGATAKWCNDVSGATITNWPVAGDSRAALYGGDFWIGTAPSCPG